MPIYEFQCPVCEMMFEERRRLAAADMPARCPRCQAAARRVLARVAAPRAPRIASTPVVRPAHRVGCSCCRPLRRGR